jgi:hypothetical protein
MVTLRIVKEAVECMEENQYETSYMYVDLLPVTEKNVHHMEKSTTKNVLNH